MRQPRFILLTVFLTGAAVLVVEVTATRILSTYFGSTIYTISSVLGVILAALSVGYWWGGRLADRRPDAALFYRLIVLAGLGILLLRFLTVTVLPTLGREMDLILGPLVSSLILFTVPSVLLGMLSPFAIALLKSGAGSAEVAGKVYAISTLGSIFGSLLAGFILIPTIGLRAIVIGTAVAVLALGLAGLAGTRKRILSLLAIILPTGVIVGTIPNPPLYPGTVYAADGRYDRITVYEAARDGREARYLAQDQNTSSGIFLDSRDLAFNYTQYASLLPQLSPNPERALAIGGGAYSVPQYLLSLDKGMIVDVAETEPKLRGLAREYFNVPDDPRLRNHLVDGRRFVATNGNYDIIFGDAYSSGLTVPAHLMTKEFFGEVRAALSPDGVFMANIVGRTKDQGPTFIMSAVRTFSQVFPNNRIVAVTDPGSKDPQNFIFIGLKSDQPIDAAALASAGRQGELVKANALDISTERLAKELIFTDDYAPVEYLIARDLWS